ncbi:MAG TPA: hypothetical protein VEQ40_10195, partial [Pyrinomonadaceae bacterium]|nr:hypothetical protein [Pyrinomonadaceae bacterium]
MSKRIASTVLAFTLLLSTALPALAQGSGGTSNTIASVLQPNSAPIVNFRIQFMTGSAFDPPGKEGLAALTAAMLAQGGTRSQTYEQLVAAVYPMGLSAPLGWQIDKE